MRRLFEVRCLTHALLAIAAVAGIFVLPFFFPPLAPVKSESYVYGFNNKICFLAVLFSIGAFFLAGLARKPFPVNSPIHLFEPAADGRRQRVAPLAVWCGCLLMFVTTAYFYTHAPGIGYGESRYFTRRMLYLLKGRSPYTDFEYLYGPALLYPAVGLHRLTAPLGMTVKDAYYIFYGLIGATGLVLLATIVNCLGINGKFKTAIFILCGLASWNETMGLQYTLFRFVLPMNCLLLIHLCLLPRMSLAGWARLPQQLVLALASIGGTAACLSISPEIGIAFYIAMLAYWFCASWATSACLPVLLLQVASLSLALTPLGQGWFRAVFGFCGGGCNLPVVPAMNVLLLLFTVLYTVPAELRLALTQRKSPRAAIFAGWAALTVAMLAGALGRCDWLHTYFYGLPALIAACAFLLQQPRPRFAVFVAAAATCLLSYQVSFCLFSYPEALPSKMAAALHRLWPPDKPPERDAAAKVRRLAHGVLPELSRSQIGVHGSIGVPLGCSESLFLYLLANDLLCPDYFDSDMSVYTQQDVIDKLTDVQRTRTILVPKWLMDDARPEDWEVQSSALGRLFLFPYGLLSRKNPAFVPKYRIIERLRATYRPIASVEGCYLLQGRARLEEPRHPR